MPVGKIRQGEFSDVLQTLCLRNGKYYARKHMKQHFERVMCPEDIFIEEIS